MVKISVVIPIYNVAEFVELSLKSVCNQKFNDFEIIVVNDGSKDESMNIVNKIFNNYKGAYKIINQQNSGLSAARNAGLRIAVGKYVCFVDSDDILDKNYLNFLYNCINKNNLIASYCDFELTKEKNRFGSNENEELSYEIFDTETTLKGFVTRKYKIHCCTLLLNRQFLIENKLQFNEKLKYGEDVQFMWRLFPRISKLGHVNSKCYKYLIRSNSLMTNQNIDKVIILQQEMKITMDTMKSDYPECINIFNYVVPRVEFGCIHSFTKQAKDYSNYFSMISRLQYKDVCKKLFKFPDNKIKILAVILYLNPKIFYMMFKRNAK